jgi:hypothetical protein
VNSQKPCKNPERATAQFTPAKVSFSRERTAKEDIVFTLGLRKVNIQMSLRPVAMAGLTPAG